MCRPYLVLLSASLAALSGCTMAKPPTADQPRKALFSWAASDEPAAAPGERSDADQSKDKESSEPEPKDTEPEPLTTERPDFTNSSRTVGRNRIQLESGYTFTSNRDAGTRLAMHSFPEALIRVGVATDWFELQIGQNALNAPIQQPVRTRNAIGIEDGLPPPTDQRTVQRRATGLQDLYLATKFALTTQDRGWPETALTIQLTVPTGARDQTAGRVLPALLYLYSWEIIPDRVSLGGSTVATGAVEDDHGYLLLAQSLSVGYTLTRRMSAFTELFALWPSGAAPARVGPEYYFNAGVLYRITPNFQIDARAGCGLNGAADDFFTGVGFAVRY